jgi:acyl transferase domain-containing protein/SAM-dependent methyltransferase/acyl carrier protein
MRYRCAIVVQNHADAIYLLEHFEAEHRPGLFKGETAREFSPRQMVRDWLSSSDRRAATLLEDPTAYREMLLSMAEFYCQGYDIPSAALHNDYLNRLHAPTYPFLQELHWPTQVAPAYVRSALTPASSAKGVLLYRPSWEWCDTVAQAMVHESGEGMPEGLVINCGAPAKLLTGIEHLSLAPAQPSIGARYTDSALELFSQIKQLLTLAPNKPRLLQLLVSAQGPEQVFSGLLGLLQTVTIEYPAVRVQCIEIDETFAQNTVQGLLAQVGLLWPCRHVRASAQGIEQKSWVEIDRQSLSDAVLYAPWRRDGVYLITGGCGGLGMIFAREIIKRAPGASVVLCGRRSPERIELTLPTGCEYLQTDIGVEIEIDALLEKIVERYGRLDGVLHAAGLLQDSLIANKTEQMFGAVLAPKVTGSEALLRAILKKNPEFIIFFSSVSAAFGNAGQADYAVACSFQNALAEHQAAQTSSRTRVLSIAWPLWRDGGMQLAQTSLAKMQNETALTQLDTQVGLATFYRAFALEDSCLLVLSGDEGKLRKAVADAQRTGLGETHLPSLQRESAAHPQHTQADTFAQPQHSQTDTFSQEHGAVTQPVTAGTLAERTLSRLTVFVAEHLQLPIEKLEPREPLEAFGVDSLMSAQLRQRLQQIFEDISPTLLYEFPTLDLLSVYLSQTYPEQCNSWGSPVALSYESASPRREPLSSVQTPFVLQELAVQPRSQPEPQTTRRPLSVSKSPVAAFALPPSEPDSSDLALQTPEPVAIIGVSVRLPGAASLGEFAENIFAGVQSISEVPAQRWNWATEGLAVQATEQNQRVGALGHWGGFIADVYAFDPLFFNITPHDASRIDPQERLFLEHCWNALADAGYAPSSLSEEVRAHAGVFAGITKQGFSFLAHEQSQEYLTTSYSALVNRVSSLLDLRGPSVAVDSMCSSALVAIHEACDYLRTGGGKLAIAGGVNLYLHPSTYTALAASQSLCLGPQCAAFAEGGDGFVPGEAVGAFVLKPYSDALRDGDSIYALLRGSAASHGGRGGGFGVPNPTQQVAVIREALKSAGLDPRSVSYIESAANGQALGDAVEMRALCEVFANRAACQGEYKIGSVKPNIGHAEAASGVAQLAKVLVSLNKQQLAPTLISGTLNRDIQFERLPFVLARECSEWSPVTVDGVEVARRAGITSVGAGGVCAHLIVEEYAAPAPEVALTQQLESGSQTVLTGSEVLIFSAKNAERLTTNVLHWLSYLALHPEIPLRDLAYTLQTGREMMVCRLAVIADNSQALQQTLRLWCERTPDVTMLPGCHWAERTGSVLLGTSTVGIAEQDTNTLAQLWVVGAVIDWSGLRKASDAAGRPRRLNGLPGYSFERRPCQLLDELRPETLQLHTRQTDAQPAAATSQVSNKAAEFYAIAADAADKTYQEEYLTFAPFPHKIPGFSVTRVCFNPEKFPLELAMVQARQREMRRTLFNMVDLSTVRKGLDFGCGHATDIIKFTEAYPGLIMDGFTITRSQAELGNVRIRDRGLTARATVYHKDSAQDPFPSNDYDLIIGVEVSFHIRDKASLFNKIAQALNDDGSVLLADYIANTRGSIIDPNVEVTIPTRTQWVEILSNAALRIDEIIDVSPQIANFLYDPDVEENIKDLPEVGQATWRNYVNQSAALEQGLISYSLIKLRRHHSGDVVKLRMLNETMLIKQKPYPFIELKDSLADASTVSRAPDAPNPSNTPQTRQASQASLTTHSLQPMQTQQMLHTRQSYASAPTVSSQLAVARTPGTVTRTGLEWVFLALTEVFVDTLKLERSDLAREQNFSQLGVGSVNALRLLEAINQRFDLTLPTSIIFSYDTLDSLAGYIAKCLGPKRHSQTISSPSISEDEVVVIGMSCRCAGADNPEQLWSLVSEGRDCLTPMPDDWQAYLLEHGTKMPHPRYGSIKNVDAFDPLFFRISPKEAENMDLTQRVLLQEGYRAFEDAGYAPQSLTDQQIGCYIGVGASTPPSNSDSPYMAMLGSDTSISASRLAYFLNLKGPVLAINTACSSSLVAIDLAYQALRNKTVDVALAGGITIWTHPAAFISMQDAGMLSPTGVCRPFDKDADGTMVGDGVGLLVLKRRAEAQRDGDHIYGVIRGSGTNQDGRTAGITVPSFLAQSRLQTSIYREQGIDVGDIQYIETHGTATKLGDPVEIHALTQSLGALTEQRGFCAVGSLKANVGHTAAAAGVLNLIKVLQCLKHRQFPPAVNYSTPNEHIDFARSPVYVNQTLCDWPVNNKGARLAAVSSFGYSGTNAHLVIEQDAQYAQSRPRSASLSHAEHSPQLIVISGQIASRLQEQVFCLVEFLETIGRGLELRDVAYTLQHGRDAMAERLAIVVSSMETLCQTLRAYLNQASVVSGNVKWYGGSTKRDLHALLADGEEALSARVDSLSRRHQLDELAALWCKGAPVDWSALYRALPVQRVSLPTYRFAQDHYPGVWSKQSDSGRLLEPTPEVIVSPHEVEQPVALEPARVQTGNSVAVLRDPSLLCFDENWQRCPLIQVEAQVSAIASLLCLVEEGALLDALQRYLTRVSPMTRMYVAMPEGREGAMSYRVKGLADGGSQADLAALAAESAQIDTVLYLLPVQQPALVKQAAAVAKLLQTLRTAGIAPGQIILVGQYGDGLELSHLESWIGFERSLTRAWPGTGLKVLMLELEVADCLTGEAWLERLWAEVLQTDGRSILYRNAERYALSIEGEEAGSRLVADTTKEPLP